MVKAVIGEKYAMINSKISSIATIIAGEN